MELDGKVAVITGGATGIGRAIAERFAAAGAKVLVNYSRSEEDAAATVAAITAASGTAAMYCADVSDDAAVRGMMAHAVATWGRIDLLVNNAGHTNFVPHADLEGLLDDYWDRAWAVNVKGMFYCCRAAADQLRANHGAVINVTSRGGISGSGSSMAYAASKAAAISVTKSFARVLAPEVRVNGIAPGIVLTRWVAGREEHVRRGADGTPLGRPAEPDDVAKVAFALAAYADFITGETITVDGGQSLGK